MIYCVLNFAQGNVIIEEHWQREVCLSRFLCLNVLVRLMG